MTLPASAQTASADKQLSLTIYNSNLALAEHVRPLRVAAGTHRIDFAGVSAQIVPQTVSFSGPGLSILEQNFDYDLLTPQKLMEKAIGQQVRIVRTNPATGQETQETAEVLSTAGGVVLRIGDRIEVLREDGIPARVIFDEVPRNLRASPTLSILANAERAVEGDATLAYLTRGLSWNADYVAVFDEKQGQVSLQGWITLRNTSGTTFENANLQLVAGDINVVNDEAQWWRNYEQRRNNANVRRAGGVEASAREQLADYYVYPIAQATTVANSQTKQLSFLSAARVTADKGYEQTFFTLQSRDEPASAEVRVRFSNSQAAGLGDQLSPRADAVAITIYRDDLALITETRTVDLPDSAVTLVIEGVAGTLLPQSAVITDLARPVAEANFDSDQLTPRALLLRSVGESVIVTRTNPATGVATRAAATVVAAGEGVILKLEGGHEALYCSGLPERLEFARIPDGLRAKPRLSVKLSPGEAGPRTVKVSYLAHGFGWSADYVARLNARGNRMELSGWATLENRTDTRFDEAEVQLVAGRLNILAATDGGSRDATREYAAVSTSDQADVVDVNTRSWNLLQRMNADAQGLALLGNCFASAVPTQSGDSFVSSIANLRGMDPSFASRTLTLVDGRRRARVAEREELGDYHLYRLPWRTDLAARQIKQVLFLDKPGVRIERFYSVRRHTLTELVTNAVVTPDLVIRWENTARSGLGEPVARGTVRVFEPYAGREVFAGEAEIGDRPVGLPVELQIGRALNVMLEVTTRFARSGPRSRLRTTAAADYRIVNNKSVPIDIEIRHTVENRYRNLQVEESSRKAGRKYGDLAWRFTVRPGEDALRYRLSALEVTE